MIGSLLRLRYELLETLGASPIFENYVARDRVRNVDVCVRLVRKQFASEPDFVQTLASVVERTKSLDHPNIARVFELDEHEDQPFIVCEPIRGSTLAEKIRRVAPFSPPVACEIAIGICEALEHAALKGIPHGDLCSDHVMTTLEGRVALIDFGLWESYSRSTDAGALVVPRMAPYLAPEIIDGAMPLPGSDVYAAGVILFELLAGRLPYTGQTPMSILAKHTTEAVPSVRALNPAIPHVLDSIVGKALAKDPVVRYANASGLLADLRALKDALRFGKQLTWPLGQPDEPAAPVKTFAEKKAERRLGPLVHAENRGAAAAVRERAEPRVRRAAKINQPVDSDVPGWLKIVVYVLSGMLVSIVIGWMILNVSKKKEVVVPNLIGISREEALQRLSTMGLKMAVDAEDFSDKFPKPDSIIQMRPSPGTPVREDSYISVRVSKGSVLVEVPDLRGTTLAEAQRRLQDAELNMLPRPRYESDSNTPEDMVLKTDPAPGEKVDRKTTIEITLSSGRRRPERQPASGEDLIPNTWSFKFRVKQSSEPVLVRVEMTDASGDDARVVFEDTRPGGEEIVLENVQGVGREVIFRIYMNNYLERTLKRRGDQT